MSSREELYVNNLYVEGKFRLLKPVWEDQVYDLAAARPNSVFTPKYQALPGSTVVATAAFEEGDREMLHFTIQTPHQTPYSDYSRTYDPDNDTKDGAIELHLHWLPEDTGSGNILFKFNYIISNRTTGLGTEVAVEKLVAAPEAIVEQITGLTSIPISSLGESSIIVCQLERTGNDATDTYGKAVYALSCDAHCLRDRLGSEEEYGDQ